MAQLRNSIIERIVQRLDFSAFCVEDFDISFPENTSNLATIIFKSLPKYSFIIEESYESNSALGVVSAAIAGDTKRILKTQEKPGEYKNHETKKHKNIDECIARVGAWVENIKEDLIAAKSNEQFIVDEVIEKFQESVNEKIKDPENYFSNEEREELKIQLDSLKERVEKLEEQFNISPDKTQNIVSTIEKSKENLTVYPKGVWFKTTGTKILKMLKAVLTTKEGRELLLEMGKNLIK